MRRRKVVCATFEQRVREVELERRHLRAEAQTVKIVARKVLAVALHAGAREHTRLRAAVVRELRAPDELLEAYGVERFDFGGRHFRWRA